MVTVVKRLGECICFFKKKIIVTEEMNKPSSLLMKFLGLLVVAFRIFKKPRKPVWKKF